MRKSPVNKRPASGSTENEQKSRETRELISGDIESRNRRRLLKALAVSGGAIAVTTIVPGEWVRPVIEVGSLPAHAQTSGGSLSVSFNPASVGELSPSDATIARIGGPLGAETYPLSYAGGMTGPADVSFADGQTSEVVIVTAGGDAAPGAISPQVLTVDGSVFYSGASGDLVVTESFPSDARLKANVLPLAPVMAKVRQLRGVSFEWNSTAETFGRTEGKREIGVIAQDVEAVFPELVTPLGDTGYRGVDYTKLSAILVEAFKEISADNEIMIARLNGTSAELQQTQTELVELKSKFAELESVLQRLNVLEGEAI